MEELRRTRDPIAQLEGELVTAGLLHERAEMLAAIETEVAQATLAQPAGALMAAYVVFDVEIRDAPRGIRTSCGK